jgi:beta-glucanase (GH16 family)
MNLLDKTRWDYLFPWGNIIGKDNEPGIYMNEKLVTYNPDGTVHFGCSHESASGWRIDKNGKRVDVRADWSVGAIISKEACRTHYGTYYFKFSLPNFRGSWPAIWMVDLLPSPPEGLGMGIPPETDIFEHFRKDGFLSRFKMTHSFHQGPTYEKNIVISKIFWRLLPLDLKDIELTYTWTSREMTWVVNGKKIMTVTSDAPKYPAQPMNLILNSGLGLDWKPNVERFEDFVVYKAEYQP